MHSLFTFIFASCCHTAADVSLTFVFFEHAFYLTIKLAVAVKQPLGDIFMCGRYKWERFRQAPVHGRV